MAKPAEVSPPVEDGTVITSNDAVQDVGVVEVEFSESVLADGTIVRTYTGVDPLITGRTASN